MGRMSFAIAIVGALGDFEQHGTRMINCINADISAFTNNVFIVTIGN